MTLSDLPLGIIKKYMTNSCHDWYGKIEINGKGCNHD